jgi:hypothetical protein
MHTPYETCGPTKHLTCKDYAIPWETHYDAVLDEPQRSYQGSTWVTYIG